MGKKEKKRNKKSKREKREKEEKQQKKQQQSLLSGIPRLGCGHILSIQRKGTVKKYKRIPV